MSFVGEEDVDGRKERCDDGRERFIQDVYELYVYIDILIVSI